MSKYEDANLILKLYELRREELLRKARNYYSSQFHPETIEDIWKATMNEETGAYVRMVTTYWDMAATLVNHGAIDMAMFSEANGEYLGVFAKIEPFIEQIRAAYPGAGRFLLNLEKLVDSMPEGRQQTAKIREWQKSMREQMLTREKQAASA
ncbi:MAG: hypothetical protein H7039_05100 [Bryobacteraceae bacterium]|nr:hypothetical protein [Bryobacteraceae bacterium]